LTLIICIVFSQLLADHLSAPVLFLHSVNYGTLTWFVFIDQFLLPTVCTVGTIIHVRVMLLLLLEFGLD
jgi:uncharacterized membrane protein